MRISDWSSDVCSSDLGLTKGQYSPTSRVGTKSPSTPFGSVDRPASPCAFALGSGGRFIARAIDTHKSLPDVLKRAHANKGASFVEIYQNCIVYNNNVFEPVTAKKAAPANTKIGRTNALTSIT